MCSISFTFTSAPLLLQNEKVQFEPTTSNAYAAGVAAAYNTARGTGISQLFTFFDFELGYLSHPVHYVKQNSSRDGRSFLYIAFDPGLMKKYFFRRISIVAGYKLGFHILSHTSRDDATSTDYSFDQNLVGSTLFGNIELLVRSTVSIGFGVTSRNRIRGM